MNKVSYKKMFVFGNDGTCERKSTAKQRGIAYVEFDHYHVGQQRGYRWLAGVSTDGWQQRRTRGRWRRRFAGDGWCQVLWKQSRVSAAKTAGIVNELSVDRRCRRLATDGKLNNFNRSPMTSANCGRFIHSKISFNFTDITVIYGLANERCREQAGR